MMRYCFGIDIGGTTVKLGLAAEDGTLLEKWEIPTQRDNTPTVLLTEIKATIEGCLQKRSIAKAQLLGIGLAAPGPVTEGGVLHGAVNIGWGDVALTKEVERIFGIAPVCVGNDARMAALGEATYGAGVGAESMLMVTLGTGVGGGVVLHGRVWTGATGVAGEIGHMTMNPFETARCHCGKRGCLEQYASATGIVHLAQQIRQTDPSFLQGSEPLTAKAIFAAAQAGDAIANEITDCACDYLGSAIANIVYIIDPERIVLGGGVSRAGEFLLQKVKRAFYERVFAHSREREFRLAELGNDAGVRGAVALLLQHKEIVYRNYE